MKPAIFPEPYDVLAAVTVKSNQPGQPETLENFRIITDAIAPLQRLRDASFVLLATTNQPGFSRGTLLRRELQNA